MSKLPRSPSTADLVRVGAETQILLAGTRLRRVYFQGGPYPSQWDSFRFFGPVRSGRFDHHLPPPAVGPRGVLYAASEATTCLAEVFQVTRRINTTLRSPWLASFAFARDVSLLDLSGAWPTRAGGSMAIDSGPRGASRAWSRAIYDAYPDVDGLLYCSSMHANKVAVALYERARDAMPARPTLNIALADPRMRTPLRNAAHHLGYDLA